jgi:hypothetical protein
MSGSVQNALIFVASTAWKFPFVNAFFTGRTLEEKSVEAGYNARYPWSQILSAIPLVHRQGWRMCQLALSINVGGVKMSINTLFEPIEVSLSIN